jgi:hypothetical protein
LAERRHFFGLLQLVMEIARLVVDAFAIRHITNDRGTTRPGHFNPDKDAVLPPQPHGVILDVPVASQLRQKCGLFFGVSEAIKVEGADVFVWGVEGETEDAFEMGIGGCRVAANLPDV